MPELPEVETIVRDLRPLILGKSFWKVRVLNRSTVNIAEDEFCNSIYKKRVKNIRRKGKYIIIHLEPDGYIVIHLRMTGRLLEDKSKENDKFIRVEFTFSDAKKLYFSDIRKFGRVWYYSSSEFKNASGLSKLGIDPFEDIFNDKLFFETFKTRRGFLKNLLLAQDIVAGIGNIYADEICFRIGLHPKSRAEKLNKEQIFSLYESILYCLKEGIKHNGATIADFRGTKGDAGKFQNYLQVYGRTGDPCYKCSTPIVKIKAAGRGTWLCEKCQKLVV